MAPTDFFNRIRSYYHKEPGKSQLSVDRFVDLDTTTVSTRADFLLKMARATDHRTSKSDEG